MIRRFCDVCGGEMIPANTPFQGVTGDRLAAQLQSRGTRLDVEVITSKNGTSNQGDFCKYCVLDALYKIDDRPRPA